MQPQGYGQSITPAPQNGRAFSFSPPGIPAPTHQYNFSDTGDGSQWNTYAPGVGAPVNEAQFNHVGPVPPNPQQQHDAMDQYITQALSGGMSGQAQTAPAGTLGSAWEPGERTGPPDVGPVITGTHTVDQTPRQRALLGLRNYINALSEEARQQYNQEHGTDLWALSHGEDAALLTWARANPTFDIGGSYRDDLAWEPPPGEPVVPPDVAPPWVRRGEQATAALTWLWGRVAGLHSGGMTEPMAWREYWMQPDANGIEKWRSGGAGSFFDGYQDEENIDAAIQKIAEDKYHLPRAAVAGQNPLGIPPALWDSMAPSARQLVRDAYIANGGSEGDFDWGIDVQRPQGQASRGTLVTQNAPRGAF